VFAALWQGIHHALGGVLIVELFASSNGIGQLIQQYTNNFQSDNALAVAVIISVLAIAVASLWSALERRLSRWRTQSWS
jgi:NitT/TauT family transport system permease protein